MPVPDVPHSDESSSDENAEDEQNGDGAGKRLLLHGLSKDIRDAAVDGELRYTAFGVPFRVGNHRMGSMRLQTSEADEAVENYHSNPMLGSNGNGGGGGGVTASNAREDGHGERSQRQNSHDMMKHSHTDYLNRIDQQQSEEREVSPLTSLNPSKPHRRISLKVKRGRMRNFATATGSIADQIVNARIKKNNATPRSLYTDPESGGIVSVSKMTGSSRWATNKSTRRMASGDGGQVSTMDAVAEEEAEKAREAVEKANEAETVHIDPASGRRFTVNDTTGLSEWLGEHDGTGDEDGAEKGQSEQQSSSHTEYVDPASRHKFRINRTTGSSKWLQQEEGEEPSGQLEQQQEQQESTHTEHVDPASRHKYRINRTTGSSKWLQQEEKEELSGQSEQEQQQSTHTEHVDPDSRHKYRINNTTGSSRWLQQEEVEEHVDPASGRRYTVDGITGLSQGLEDEDGDGDGYGDGDSGGDGDGDGDDGVIDTSFDSGQVVQEEDGTRSTVVALYDYTCGEDGHIELRAGETVVIVVRDTNGDGWTRVREAESEEEEGGKGLLCPTSYLDWRTEAQLAS